MSAIEIPTGNAAPGRGGAAAVLAGTHRVRRHVPLTVVIPGAFLAIVILAAIFAPLVAPYGPTTGSISERLMAVGSPGHLLGTDGQGRDILSRLIWGARPTLLEGILPVVVAGVIGTVLGVVASLSGRKVHTLIMRTLDVLYSFPAVLLAIALAAALGAGVVNAIVALTIVLIAPIARVAETEVARMRSSDFMEAARASGASWPRIARRQVLPIIAPVLLVYCTALVGLAIVFAGGLSFLGLGIAPPHPEWGSMLNELDQDLYNQPVLALIPAAMIFVTSVAFNVLGDGLRDLLDIHSETVS
ncbi:MAG TPA: ABC transporter permease [Acidimicrobiales bacterium]|jgi:peptide/nickel transport system permease protein|nr:ABC transporter permease [Acidimicrobiales bacterium]